ncbi:MAG: hypothetical protein RBR38_10275 [Desulfomicrobium apsheronum]|nr:hypothetical protein [Desulfomicrobium apsheronum]
MSEIARCPICGQVPLDKWEVTSVRVFQTGQMCCGVDCNTNERWNQYAAAMKAEARHNALVEAVCNLRKLEKGLPDMGLYEAHKLITSAARAEVDRLLTEGDG